MLLYVHSEQQGIEMNIPLLAARIYVKLHEDKNFAKKVFRSNEPFRAMHMECGFREADEIVDGSAEYCDLIDYIEHLNANDSVSSEKPQTTWADDFV